MLVGEEMVVVLKLGGGVLKTNPDGVTLTAPVALVHPAAVAVSVKLPTPVP